MCGLILGQFRSGLDGGLQNNENYWRWGIQVATGLHCSGHQPPRQQRPQLFVVEVGAEEDEMRHPLDVAVRA